VSTTVLVGRSERGPASIKRDIKLCFVGVVYFCQSEREYGSFFPLVLAEVAVMGVPKVEMSFKAKSCWG